MWQILADDYTNETSVAKGLLVKVEFNTTVNSNIFKDSMILVDALTEDCDLIFESSINEVNSPLPKDRGFLTGNF